MRGPDRAYEKPRSTLRVLALGDSFVESFMVSDRETVTARLEDILARELSCPVEVLNGGTAGYSTDQEYLFYREEGRKFAPDLVVLFTYHNDLPYLVSDQYLHVPKPKLDFTVSPPRVSNSPVPGYRPPARDASPKPRVKGSLLARFVRDRLERSAPRLYNTLASLRFWPPTPAQALNDELLFYVSPARRRLDPVWEAYELTLKALDDLTRANRAKLVVGYIPSRLEISSTDLELTEIRHGLAEGTLAGGTVRDRIDSIAGAARIPFLDLTPALKARATWFAPVFFPTDLHWNARGMDTGADAMASFLKTRGLLVCPSP